MTALGAAHVANEIRNHCGWRRGIYTTGVSLPTLEHDGYVGFCEKKGVRF